MYSHKSVPSSWCIKSFSCLCLAIFVFGQAYANATDVVVETREQRVAEMAHQAILIQLLILRNPASHSLCEQNRYACLGPNPAELGLATLGVQSGRASDTELLKILRYRIDAGLFEDYSCYMLQRGKGLADILHGLNPSAINALCKQEVSDKIKKYGALFDRLRVENVCANELEIKRHLDELRDAIGRGAQCDPQDF